MTLVHGKGYVQRTLWNCGSQIFIVYLNIVAPQSTLMTLNLKRFLYRTYFVK